MREIAADRGTLGYHRQWAAESLAGLGPQYHEEAAAALREIAADRAAKERKNGAWRVATVVYVILWAALVILSITLVIIWK